MSLLTKAQEASIISYLEKNFALPKSGFVAGQAVASLIYKELNLNLKKPINDVDVFQLHDSKNHGFFDVKMESHQFNKISSNNHYRGSGQALSAVDNFRKGYRVAHSSYLDEDPSINIVLIEQASIDVNNPMVDGLMLINSFDFNCCAVGFHIETGEFIYNQAFLDFVKSKQLRVQSVHTAYHSWLRLNKKLKDLGDNVYCSINTERFILLKAMSANLYKNVFVGERFLNLMKEHGDDTFKNIMEISDLDNTKYKKIKVNENLLDSPDMSEYAFSLKKESECLSDIFTPYSEFSGLTDSINFVSMVHLCYETGLFNNKYSKKIDEFRKKTKSNRFSFSYILQKMSETPLNKIKGDLPVKKINRIEKLIDKHERLINFITYRKNNISTIDEKIDFLEALYFEIKKDNSKEGIIGLLELNQIPFNKVKENYKKPIKEFVSSIINTIEGAEENLKKKNMFKDGSFNLPFLKIKQLRTIEDFFNEGKEMNHCILGHYPYFLRNENPLYFSLTFFNERASVSLDKEYGTNDKGIWEYRGESNRAVSKKHVISRYILLSLVNNKEIDISYVLKRSMTHYYRDFRFTKHYSKMNKIKNRIVEKMIKFKLIKKPESAILGYDDDIPF